MLYFPSLDEQFVSKFSVFILTVLTVIVSVFLSFPNIIYFVNKYDLCELLAAPKTSKSLALNLYHIFLIIDTSVLQ